MICLVDIDRYIYLLLTIIEGQLVIITRRDEIFDMSKIHKSNFNFSQAVKDHKVFGR